jgi:rhamnosyltransferase subunit B
MSHVLLLSYGTSGSTYPFIWLGRQLMAHGHDVTLITAPRYEALAKQAGLDFAATPGDELEQMLRDPRLWQLGWGLKSAYTHGGRAARDYVATVEKVAEAKGGADLILAPMICFGARILREKLGIPLVTTHLYPMMIIKAHWPPVVIPPFRWLRSLPLNVRQTILWFPNPLDLFAMGPVRRCSRSHGVRPRSLWKQWWNSPDGVLALFPDWFAEPQPDWPQNLLQWDFPLEDMGTEQPVDDALARFLAAGEKPVFFTAGTGHFHAAKFLATSVKLVEALGCRAVFITPRPEQLPGGLPDSLFVTRYAPFRQILPQARAFVHHGGIGTTSQCLAAGVPQLVVPMSLDQPDNADRVARLGVGLQIPHSRFTPAKALPLLRRVLADETIALKVSELAVHMQKRRDPAELVRWLESRFKRPS